MYHCARGHQFNIPTLHRDQIPGAPVNNHDTFELGSLKFVCPKCGDSAIKARPAYVAPSLYDALKAEGFVLPDECGNVTLELPVDGMAQLVCRINMTYENIGQIGRALARLAEKA